MTGSGHRHRIRQEIPAVIAFIGILWGVFALDLFLPLEKLALLPRHAQGLAGIVFSPLLHANLGHIVSNTVPLFVLLVLLAGSRANSAGIVVTTIVIGGSLHWLFGRPVYVVGASGLIFGLITFLIASGVIEKRLVPMMISIAVGFLYGSTLLSGVLPGQPGVSWDGHLFGAIGGVLAAWLLARRN